MSTAAVAGRLPALAPPAAVAVAAAGVLVTLGVRDPNEPGMYPNSPSRELLGIYCPGCGSLRGLHALVTGDPMAMVASNPMLPIGIAVLVWAWLVRTGNLSGWWQLRPLPSSRRFLYGFVGVVVAFAAARNLPFGPFSALAP